MPCDDCASLRRENEELRAILYPADDLTFRLAKRLRLRPQEAKVLARLLRNPGSVVPHDDLQRAADYSGGIGTLNARQGLSQQVAGIRRALAEIGGKTSDLISWHKKGYALKVEAAHRVRALL